MDIEFKPVAWNDYNNWATENMKIFQKILALITDIVRQPFTGLGKPEPLRGNLSGKWSRRITDEHRLVYRVSDDTITIYSCRFHYKEE